MAKRKRKQPDGKAAAPAAPVADVMAPAIRVAWWSLLGLAFIVPIAISNLSIVGAQLPLTFDQFDIIKVFFQRVLTLVALTAWAWQMFTRGGKIRRTPVDWLILAFLAWVTLSTIFSIHVPTAFFGKYRRFEGLLSFLNYAAIYFLTLQLADRPSRIRRLAQTIFWSGTVVTLYGLMQAAGMDPFEWGDLPFEARRSFSTYGNPDLFGGFLMFSTFISAGLALSERRLGWRAVYWGGFAMSALCLITAFTRSAWVGSTVGFTLMIVIALYQRTKWETEDYAFAGVAGGGVALLAVRSLSSQDSVMNFGKRVVSIFQFNEGSARTRFEIWQAAIDAVKDRPIFGFGPDTFRLVFPRYKPVEYVKDAGYLSVADNVHNYPLQLASGVGVPGVVMLYSIFIWAAVRTFRLVFNREGGPNRIILAGFWVACVAYLVHLFFGLSVTGTTFLLWLSMAAVLSPTAVTRDVRAVSWGAFAGGAVALLAIAGIIVQILFMQADRAYLRARIGTPQARIAAAQDAVRLNPFNDMYRAEISLQYTYQAQSAAQQLQQGGANAEQLQAVLQDNFRRAEQANLQTIEFVPAEYDNYVFITNLYTLGGQFIDQRYLDDAIEWGLKGIEVEEFGPAIRFQLARAYLSKGDTDKATEQLGRAIEMDPAYTEAVSVLASVYEQLGKESDALRVLKIGAPYDREGALKSSIQRLEASTTTTPSAVPTQ